MTAALDRVRRLTRDADYTGTDPLCAAILAVGEIAEGNRELVDDVRRIAERTTAPEMAQKLAAAAARGASQGVQKLARAQLYRTALWASLALAVALAAGVLAGRASVDDSFLAACLKVGRVKIDKDTKRPYCAAAVWIGSAQYHS